MNLENMKVLAKSERMCLYIEKSCAQCGGTEFTASGENGEAALRMSSDGGIEAGPFKCLSCGGPIRLVRTQADGAGADVSEQKHYVRGAEFHDKVVNLSPAIVYRNCDFDDCDIHIGNGDMIPEACHIEGCSIYLKDGLTLDGFLSALSVEFSFIQDEDKPTISFGVGSRHKVSHWINCKVFVDGVERCLFESANELRARRLAESSAKRSMV